MKSDEKLKSGFGDFRASMAFVFRGDVFSLKQFSVDLEKIISEYGSEVRIVYRLISASRLWIKEGGDLEERSNSKEGEV